MGSKNRLFGGLLAGVMLSAAAQPTTATEEIAPAQTPADAGPKKLICTKVTPVGSLMPVKRCITAEQQQREKDTADRVMREQSGRSPTGQSPN
jgi:hypothetical protein